MIGVVEKDDRHGKADFAKEKRSAPADLKHLLADVEFIEYRRRDFEAKAMVDEILRRAGLRPKLAAHEPEPEPDRLSTGSSAASEDSVGRARGAKRRIASCVSVLKIDIGTIPEGSEEREKFKQDFTREMATALGYLVTQKLTSDGVEQVKMLVEDVKA